LHWTLDVAFGEDDSIKKIGNSAQNFSILNKVALNLLKNEKLLNRALRAKDLRRP
jgi:predicted transposase YbfD/YdcC